MFKFLFLLVLIFSISNASAVVVLETKKAKALVLLEGLRTKPGSYFHIFDLYNNKKGLARMDRVADTKAIVTLKSGAIAKKWSLQPVSQKLAFYELKKEKNRKAKSARIHQDQMKRKMAFKKKKLAKKIKRMLAFKKKLKRKKQQKIARMKALEKKRRLARRKEAVKRKLASYRLEENVLEDLGIGKEVSSQSSEILSYNMSPIVNDDNKDNIILNGETELEPLRKESRFKNFTLGVIPYIEYDFMQVSPPSGSDYFMNGIGFGAVVSSSFSLNRFLDLMGNIGYKRFSASTGDDECGQSRGCSLLINYILVSLGLKFNLFQFYEHKFWIMGEGALLQPLSYYNRVPNLTKESFSPFHGTVGGGVGVDFNLGGVIIPVFISSHIYMPPTQTTLTGEGALHVGLFYKF